MTHTRRCRQRTAFRITKPIYYDPMGCPGEGGASGAHLQGMYKRYAHAGVGVAVEKCCCVAQRGITTMPRGYIFPTRSLAAAWCVAAVNACTRLVEGAQVVLFHRTNSKLWLEVVHVQFHWHPHAYRRCVHERGVLLPDSGTVSRGCLTYICW